MKRDKSPGFFDTPLPAWAKGPVPPASPPPASPAPSALERRRADSRRAQARGANPAAGEIAELRRELGIERSSSSAKRASPTWWPGALAAVRAYASSHELFLAEDVRATDLAPREVDKRAWGSVMRAACREGIVEHAGFAPANSSNRGPKNLWRSKVLRAT